MQHETPKDLKSLLDRLYARQNFGIKMGLEVEEALLDRMGHPERSFAALHVAGTNGKGSVCALLDSMVRVAGLRVGIYTSPHLVRFNERIQVGGVEVTDEELAGLFATTEPLVAEVARAEGREPTFFECTTAMAFEHFRQKHVQIAVLETGLGGRLDATNVVTPAVSVITRVSIEHTAYLGKDIESIAREKAGIIKPGRPVVAGATDPAALAVHKAVARERGSTLVYAPDGVSVTLKSADISGQKVTVETGSASYGTLRLPMVGGHQLENLATAVAALETFGQCGGPALDPDAVKQGVTDVSWRGRLQLIERDPPSLLDGGHNPGAGRALAEWMKKHMKGRPLGLVVGMCADKDAKGFLRPFSGLVDRFWAVPVRSERSRPAAELATMARALDWDARESTVFAALDDARAWAAGVGGVVCVCGSLFLVGEILERIERGRT